MAEEQWLVKAFEERRMHMQSVAQRMLGSDAEAEDAVQEAWIRVSRAGADDVSNLGGWLTTVVSRVCLDMLRSRKARRTTELPERATETVATSERGSDPEREAIVADAIGPALLVVLNLLSPGERLAFVLHDLFAMPFDEIAPIIGRSIVATRQLASRARRRVQGGTFALEEDRSRQREVVAAFLAASQNGEFDQLLAMLDPSVVLRADGAAVAMAAASQSWDTLKPETPGAKAVATRFSGHAKAARLAFLDGEAGAAWVAGGKARVAFAFTVVDCKIIEIELIADPETLTSMELELA